MSLQLTTKLREWLVSVGGERSMQEIRAVYPGNGVPAALAWLEEIGVVVRVGECWQALDRLRRLIPAGGIAQMELVEYRAEETPGSDKGSLGGQPMRVPSMADGAKRIQRIRNQARAEIMPQIIAEVRSGVSITQAMRNAGRYGGLRGMSKHDADQIREAAQEAVRNGLRHPFAYCFSRKKMRSA